VNACFGILWGVGLYFIGVPYAALWGTVAALFRIVPYLGSMIGGAIPLILSLAVFDAWLPPVLVLLLFGCLELATANFIEPWLYGTHTGISPLALLLTTVFWATLWGPSGLILSTPLTVCLVVLGRHVPQFSFLHVLLGDEQVFGAEAQLYQRLLAMDDQGARVVVERHLAGSTMLKLYDSVVIPTMTMIETDRHKGALDADCEEFIFMSLREMLGDLSVRMPKAEVAKSEGRFLCLPAHDQADEVTAAMWAQLLEAEGCVAISLPNDGRLQHMLRMIAPTDEDIFCIAALPPFAFARARNLCMQLRQRYPKTKIVVGIWGFTCDAVRAIERFQPSMPDHFVTSFETALNCLLERGGRV
jgi:AI-2E family transporter